MLRDDELPPLPTESYVDEDGLWEQRVVLTEDSVREYARAVEKAAYAAAIKACAPTEDDDALDRQAKQECVVAIESLMQEQPE